MHRESAFELPVACTPEQRIAVELLVGRRVLQPHLRQIDLQLFGDQHRDRRVGALAHLDIGHGQRRSGRRAPMRMKALGAKASAAGFGLAVGERQAAGPAAGRRRRPLACRKLRRERLSRMALLVVGELDVDLIGVMVSLPARSIARPA